MLQLSSEVVCVMDDRHFIQALGVPVKCSVAALITDYYATHKHQCDLNAPA